jgi:hypothetical protein
MRPEAGLVLELLHGVEGRRRPVADAGVQAPAGHDQEREAGPSLLVADADVVLVIKRYGSLSSKGDVGSGSLGTMLSRAMARGQHGSQSLLARAYRLRLRRVPLGQALQTLRANQQPEQGSADFQSNKHRRVHGNKHPGIGEQGEGRDADRPQQHTHKLCLALEPLETLRMQPRPCFSEVPHGGSLRRKRWQHQRPQTTEKLTHTTGISGPTNKHTIAASLPLWHTPGGVHYAYRFEQKAV